jgi:hypothetical protein
MSALDEGKQRTETKVSNKLNEGKQRTATYSLNLGCRSYQG